MVIYSDGGSEYNEVAERIAAERGEPIVSTLDSAAPGEDVIYVGSPSEIDGATLLRLQRRSLDRSNPGRFSVITGYTPEAARNLYDAHRNGGTDGDHVISLNIPPENLELDPDEDATVLLGDRLTVGQLRDRDLYSLTMATHGWSIHLSLPDGFLCGFPDTIDVDDYDGPHPYCVQDGQKECPLDGDLVSAESLNPAHVFLVSCGSVIDNSLPGLPVHVVMGLLKGATSLIGSYRISMWYPHVALLHYSLLRAGYGVSDRCYILNQNSHVNKIMAYPYVPFGHPDAGVADPTPTTYEASVERTNDRVVLRFDSIRTHVIDLEIPHERLPPTDDRYYLRNPAESDEGPGLHYTLFDEGDHLRVILYAGRLIEMDQLTLHLSPTRIENERREIAADCLGNVERHRNLGILSGKGKRRAENLHEQVSDLPERSLPENFRTDMRSRITSDVNNVFGHVDGLEEELVEWVAGGDYFLDKYSNRAIEEAVSAAEMACDNCGRQVFVKEVSDGRQTRRAIGVCPLCGFVFDVPVVGRDIERIRPVIEGDLLGTGTDRRTVQVTFENPGTHHLRTVFCPSLLVGQTSTDGSLIFDPSTVRMDIGPESSGTATFSMDPSVVETEQSWLLARVIANLEVYSALAPIRCGEQVGYVHQSYR